MKVTETHPISAAFTQSWRVYSGCRTTARPGSAAIAIAIAII